MAAIFNETNNPSTVTGKPEGIPGWLPGRMEATGYGVAESALEMLKDLNIPPNQAKVAIQGFGNVGSYTAKFLFEKGVKIVSIADIGGIIYDENGIDVEKLMDYASKHGNVAGFPTKDLDKEEFWGLPVDVLIPAAIGNVITIDNVNTIKAKGIVEAANMPIHYKAEKVLTEKGILIFPDIISNAGGVIASGEEYSKSLSAKYMKKEETYKMISERIMNNLRIAKDISNKEGVSLNLACYILALQRIFRAHNMRGWS